MSDEKGAGEMTNYDDFCLLMENIKSKHEHCPKNKNIFTYMETYEDIVKADALFVCGTDEEKHLIFRAALSGFIEAHRKFCSSSGQNKHLQTVLKIKLA